MLFLVQNEWAWVSLNFIYSRFAGHMFSKTTDSLRMPWNPSWEQSDYANLHAFFISFLFSHSIPERPLEPSELSEFPNRNIRRCFNKQNVKWFPRIDFPFFRQNYPMSQFPSKTVETEWNLKPKSEHANEKNDMEERCTAEHHWHDNFIQFNSWNGFFLLCLAYEIAHFNRFGATSNAEEKKDDCVDCDFHWNARIQ